jgi:hypothetical protein
MKSGRSRYYGHWFPPKSSVTRSGFTSTCLRPSTSTPTAAHALIAEVHPIDVDDQQLDLIEAPLQQLLQRGSKASMVSRLTVVRDTPIVSAISGMTLP